jgi:hypothetical protein
VPSSRVKQARADELVVHFEGGNARDHVRMLAIVHRILGTDRDVSQFDYYLLLARLETRVTSAAPPRYPPRRSCATGSVRNALDRDTRCAEPHVMDHRNTSSLRRRFVVAVLIGAVAVTSCSTREIRPQVHQVVIRGMQFVLRSSSSPRAVSSC